MTREYRELPLRLLMQRHENFKFHLGQNIREEDLEIDKEDIKRITELMSGIGVKVPDDFAWTVVCNNGENRGKLYRRLMYLSGKQVSMGNHYPVNYAVQQAVNAVKRYNRAIIDWTFTIDWRKGDFGDPRSCYFPPGGYVRSMRQNGGGAVRAYYHKNGKLSGCARAWISIDEPEPHKITIYNAYGTESVDSFAIYLSKVLCDLGYGNFEHNRVRVSRNGSAHLNGDASLVWNTDIYKSESTKRVTLMLKQESL